MTKLEASHLFQLDEYENLLEAYEFKVFELKQFLLSKVPFVQTYGSRYKQIDKLQEAYNLLDGEELESKLEFNFKLTDQNDLLTCWTEHQKMISEWKFHVGKATGLMELKRLMEMRLKAYEWYARNWLKILRSDSVQNDVKASIEYDPMDVLEAIKASEGKYEGNEMLMKESKRLVLWLNINGYE